MKVTTEQLGQISVFKALSSTELDQLRPHTAIASYQQGEIIMHDGDRLTAQLYAVLQGSVRITKTAATGKETILRLLEAGEMFAAPALLGNGIAPATVTAETDCQIVMVQREALLDAIRSTPEIALAMLRVFNQRLQQLHNTVHGLISERAIIRLGRYIQYMAAEHGTEPTPEGDRLRIQLSHYQLARSIGITYEECVRLFKQCSTVLTYSRGGKITIVNWQELEAIASGEDLS